LGHDFVPLGTHRAAFICAASMHALKLNAVLAVAIEPASVQQQIGHLVAVPFNRLANPGRRAIVIKGDQPAPIIQVSVTPCRAALANRLRDPGVVGVYS
jgi:hypothetical protein